VVDLRGGCQGAYAKSSCGLKRSKKARSRTARFKRAWFGPPVRPRGNLTELSCVLSPGPEGGIPESTFQGIGQSIVKVLAPEEFGFSTEVAVMVIELGFGAVFGAV
jgi:hypothetical protein